MKIKMKMILAAMLLAAGIAGKANATIAISTVAVSASAAPTILVSTPTATSAITGLTQTTKLKSCMLSNDGTLNSCVYFKDMAGAGLVRLVMCANAQAQATFPPGNPGAMTASGTPGALPNYVGEDLVFTGGLNVYSSSGTVEGSSLYVNCSYITK